jgi:uncharacterized protein YneF (UPF0154 family)
MEKETIDRLTVVGLVIFFALGILYMFWDRISQIRPDIQLNPPVENLPIPAFNFTDLLNFDWFNSMDPASKLILTFVMTILVGTFIGGFLLYVRYRAQNAAK